MKHCSICGKQYTQVWRRVKFRGKYNPTIKKKKYPNLQWVKLPARNATHSVAGGPIGKRVKACTKCIKALSKRKS